jgi:hypothetical protein
MIRFTTKALLIAAFALITFVATAPTASADSGTLEVDGSNLVLSNFTVSGSQVDVNVTTFEDYFGLYLASAFGDVNSFSIVDGSTTYTFSGLYFWGSDAWGGLDYTFKKESTSGAVPEPGTILLMGSGLLALALFSTRKALRA